jgi:glutathione S-transferase
MRLYYSPGAASLAAHIALREADRSFDLVRVDLNTRRTANGEDFASINPKLDVPALQLDESGAHLLTEVGAIAQYVADLVPDKRLAPPNGTFARYRLQEWLAFIGVELDAPFHPLFEPATPSPVQARLRAQIGEKLAYCADELYARGFVLGETFSVADAYLYVVLRWSERAAIDPHLWPNLSDYYARVADRPAVIAALAAEGLSEHRRIKRIA